MSWDEFSFKKGEMCFIAQDYETSAIITVLNGRTETVIRNYFQNYDLKVRQKVKFITMDMYSPYFGLVKRLFPNAQIILDRFHIMQHLARGMNRLRIQIMNDFKNTKSIEYRGLKKHWRLIQKNSYNL
ncbi:transposase, partial [Streptococcus danieliae]|nr:transposase [Streptococcus danieliae]